MTAAICRVVTRPTHRAIDLSLTSSALSLCRFKYILALDGNTAPSSRMVNAMFSGSAIMRQESPHAEFWYTKLVPYIHYIPVSYDGSDLLHKVRWARSHDSNVQSMAMVAKSVARLMFTDDNIACYYYRLLTKYSILQNFKPELTAGFERLTLTDAQIDFLQANSEPGCAEEQVQRFKATNM
jgi:hypothetical protein